MTDGRRAPGVARAGEQFCSPDPNETSGLIATPQVIHQAAFFWPTQYRIPHALYFSRAGTQDGPSVRQPGPSLRSVGGPGINLSGRTGVPQCTLVIEISYSLCRFGDHRRRTTRLVPHVWWGLHESQVSARNNAKHWRYSQTFRTASRRSCSSLPMDSIVP